MRADTVLTKWLHQFLVMAIVTIAVVMAVVAFAAPGADAQSGAAADEPMMMLLRTDAGDILVEFYDDIAPQTAAQVRALAKAGGYNGMPFVRVIDGFIIQAGQVEAHRIPVATQAQLDLVNNLPVESDPAYLHTRGTLSLARFEDPNSGTSSFSVLLGDFPHLDGEYTVFGRVVDGMAVADTLGTVPVGVNDAPASPIQIWGAYVGTEADLRAVDFYNSTPSEAAAEAIASVPGIATGSTITASGGVATRSTSAATTGALIAAAIFGIAAFLLADRLEPRFVGALGLLAALAAGFGLFVAMVPSSGPTAAVIFFICLIAFLRLLSRFESIGSPLGMPQADPGGTSAAGGGPNATDTISAAGAHTGDTGDTDAGDTDTGDTDAGDTGDAGQAGGSREDSETTVPTS